MSRSMSADPISRLAFAISEIDKCLGQKLAREHPEVLCAVMASAASDFAALAVERGLGAIALALAEDAVEPPALLRAGALR